MTCLFPLLLISYFFLSCVVIIPHFEVYSLCLITSAFSLQSHYWMLTLYFAHSTGIIRRADKLYYGKDPAFYTIFLFNILNLLIPIIKLLVWRDEAQASVWLYVFIISSTVINFCFGIIVYNLLYVAIFGKSMQIFVCHMGFTVCCLCRSVWFYSFTFNMFV